jgi:5-(carboxyamino)imidazole ribonucleotide mutase
VASQARAIIIMGSLADREHAASVRSALEELGVAVEARVASAHKSLRHLLAMLEHYEAQGGNRVYIAIAGRSNALAGVIDAHVVAPVITCPPYSDRFGGADIYSSLRMPSGICPLVVLEPENAALAAAKVLSLACPELAERIKQRQEANERALVEADASLKEH